jgi:type I restriction enzyme S subunit
VTSAQKARLGDVATFLRGINFKPDDVVPVGTEGSVACMRTKNVQELLGTDDVWGVPESFVRRPEQILQVGDILVSSANSWNLVGKCCWIPELPWKTTFGGFISAIRGDHSKVDARFLYWWFASDKIQALLRSFGQKTTNISNLNVERCLNLELPLPPLSEQRRIAAILDQADALRAKRREALAELDKLAQSIFVEMFGDPVTNDRQWPSAFVSDFVSGFESGKSIVADDEDDSNSPFRVLKISAVTSLEYKPEHSKAIPSNYTPPKSHIVKNGDLLFSRANTTELIGATAYVNETPENLLLPDKLWRFVWFEPPRAAPLYVRHLFQQVKFRQEIGQRASGTSGSMQNISQPKVLSIQVGNPPLSLQREFATRIQAVESLKDIERTALSEQDSLFTSLQHRAFRGEL